MLQKCANPACTAPFRSLHEGKLFLAEFHSTFAERPDDGRRKTWHREHFWLCDACAARLTLRFDRELGMTTVPLGQSPEVQFVTGKPQEKS